MIRQRLKQLQSQIIEKDIDLYYMNTSDYHMSEYVPEYFKTIAYFTGFTGSLATLLVSSSEAYIFVDGRYHTQADKQCLKNGVKVVKLGLPGSLEPLEFINQKFHGKTIGFDGKRTSISFVKSLISQNNKIRSIDIYSSIMKDRAPLVQNEIHELKNKYTGLPRRKKLELIQYCLNGKTHIVNNLEAIAYILNLRGSDIAYTPVFLSYLVFFKKDIFLFCDSSKLNDNVLDSLYADGIIIRPYDAYYNQLDLISKQTIILDENKVNFETYKRISANKNTIINKRSLIDDMKSIKNNVEQENSKKAHIYDGVAMLRFLMWIDSIDKTAVDEYDVARKIDEFRLAYKAFDISFNSIVAYNENAAIIHYSPEKGKAKRLDNQGILLVDTGGQYYEGTTDITRTISLGPVSDEIKKHFTLVLKSMFNLSETKFIKGINGQLLDVIARKDLWAENLDYRHGTGHGVGHISSVHEGPPNIRYMNSDTGIEKVELKPGMIVSDEPGVYIEGSHGVRCENLLLCKPHGKSEYGEFLKFETLTLVPFDLKLIDKRYLDNHTLEVLNNYHQRVYKTLLPYLNEDEAKFLRRITREI